MQDETGRCCNRIMDYNLLIDRVQEELLRQSLGQKIWIQSATDREAGDAHSEGLAIAMHFAEAENKADRDEDAEGEQVFTLVYFRIFPCFDRPGYDEAPKDCVIEIGYTNPHAELENAKDEALSLLPSLPRPAFLDHIRDPDLAASSLKELEPPHR